VIEGGCFCGSIRYAIEDGEYPVVNCHCSLCRKISAAPFVTWITVPRDAFKLLTGIPKGLKSSDRGSRQFCSTCGTPLTFITEDRPPDIDVTTGSLDEPDRYIPVKAVHQESKLDWLGQTE